MPRSVILLAALAPGFAPAPLPKPTRHVSTGILGEWEVVSWTKELGRDFTLEEGRPGMAVQIAGGGLRAFDGEGSRGWRLTFDANTEPPCVDFLCDDPSPVLVGIYKRQRDTLTICYRDPREGRPTEFHNKKQGMLVLRRKRPPSGKS